MHSVSMLRIKNKRRNTYGSGIATGSLSSSLLPSVVLNLLALNNKRPGVNGTADLGVPHEVPVKKILRGESIGGGV